jgi:hypothetical protein
MKTKIFFLILLLCVSNSTFGEDREEQIYIGFDVGGLYLINFVFEYSMGNPFSIVAEAGFCNPIGLEFNASIHGRYYIFEKPFVSLTNFLFTNELYVNLGLGYIGNFAENNCFTIEPQIGWRFKIGSRRVLFVLEPHISYPFIIPINGQYNHSEPPHHLSLFGIFGQSMGINIILK